MISWQEYTNILNEEKIWNKQIWNIGLANETETYMKHTEIIRLILIRHDLNFVQLFDNGWSWLYSFLVLFQIRKVGLVLQSQAICETH